MYQFSCLKLFLSLAVRALRQSLASPVFDIVSVALLCLLYHLYNL